MFYCLSFPDAPSYTGSPGVECRNTEFFYWEIKRQIKALGIRNLKCSFSSGSAGESEGGQFRHHNDIHREGERAKVKMLTSDLRISFWESHYPPLLVSTSSTLALVFLLCLWRHTVQGSGLQKLWTLKLSGMHVQEFSMCVAILESHWWLTVL